MKRTLLTLSALLVLSATLFTVVGTGVAEAAPVASGSVACTVTGKGAFTPALTLTGGSSSLGINFGAVSPTSGGCFSSATAPNSAGLTVPVTITAVSITGTGSLVPIGSGSPNKCAVFRAADTIGVIKVKYTWTSTPAIAPTVLTFTGGTTHIVSGATLDNIVLPAATGTTEVTTGSFAPAVHPLVGLKTSIAAPCAAGWGPYPAFTINTGSLITLP